MADYLAEGRGQRTDERNELSEVIADIGDTVDDVVKIVPRLKAPRPTTCSAGAAVSGSSIQADQIGADPPEPDVDGSDEYQSEGVDRGGASHQKANGVEPEPHR